MNWLKQFNQTIDFIEDNINTEISKDDIEKISYSSYGHFSKMFFILSGLTISEYIRKRRLSLAASDLITTDNKIIDIALKYQYQTPESFTKAFKHFHKVSPSEARKKQSQLISYPKLSFQLTIKGGLVMKYDIIKKDNLDFVGYEIDVTTIDGQNFKDIPAFWGQVMQDGRFKTLLDNCDELGILGLCYDWRLEENKFKYMIGIRNKDITLENAKRVSFKPDVFAQFECVGKLPESVQKTTNYIYQEWFPSSNYEHSDGPELEIYPQGDTNSEDYICYYLVPIINKK